MTHYAVTQVHFEHERVVRVLLHVVENTGPGEFGLSDGVDTDESEIANLVVSGNRVYLARTTGPGEYSKAGEVQLKQGDDALISAMIGDQPALLALKALPQY